MINSKPSDEYEQKGGNYNFINHLIIGVQGSTVTSASPSWGIKEKFLLIPVSQLLTRPVLTIDLIISRCITISVRRMKEFVWGSLQSQGLQKEHLCSPKHLPLSLPWGFINLLPTSPAPGWMVGVREVGLQLLGGAATSGTKGVGIKDTECWLTCATSGCNSLSWVRRFEQMCG